MTTVIQAQDSFVTNTAFAECISTAFLSAWRGLLLKNRLLLPPERPDYVSRASRTGREEGMGQTVHRGDSWALPERPTPLLPSEN